MIGSGEGLTLKRGQGRRGGVQDLRERGRGGGTNDKI